VEITYTTVPGAGAVRHITTRAGQRFGLVEDRTGRQLLLIYEPPDSDDPTYSIELDADEADQVAEILHSRPLLERLDALERRLLELDRRP